MFNKIPECGINVGLFVFGWDDGVLLGIESDGNFDGEIENVYTLKILNKSQTDNTYKLSVKGIDNARWIGEQEGQTGSWWSGVVSKVLWTCADEEKLRIDTVDPRPQPTPAAP